MKFTSLVYAAASGSVGGLTYSHNKGGKYVRARAIPTIATSTEAMQAKAFLATGAAAFGNLTQGQRDSWNRAGTEHPEIDSLGESHSLTGIALFIRSRTRTLRAGDADIDNAPIGTDPDSLSSLVGSFDIGAGDFDVTFTPTPLEATERLWLKAAVVDSAGINYVEDKLKLVTVSPLAQTSPYDLQADIEARFGTLVVGQKVVVLAGTYESLSGKISQLLRVEGIVVTT